MNLSLSFFISSDGCKCKTESRNNQRPGGRSMTEGAAYVSLGGPAFQSPQPVTPEHDFRRFGSDHASVQCVESQRHHRQSTRRRPEIELLQSTQGLSWRFTECADDSWMKLELQSDETGGQQGGCPQVGWDEVRLQLAENLARDCQETQRSRASQHNLRTKSTRGCECSRV